MKAKFFLGFTALGIILCSSATAMARKKQKGHITLVEAYNKPVEDGAQGLPMTGDHFIIKWNDATYPETFFWRGGSGWLTCKIEKVHRAAKNGPYTVETDNINQVHAGDTLMLSPVTGGRFPIPKEIPATAKNTLFFKTAGSQWLSLPIKTITKK